MCDRAGPVVLLGFDAGDPDLLERWAAEGQLPALARLMERGTWARTGGRDLLCEHGIWLSTFGGVSWAQHGFHFFWQPRPGSYELELVRGADLGVPPLWAELRGTGHRVLILDPPDTAPAPGLLGKQVSEWATHSHYPPLKLAAEPPAALRAVERHFGSREQIGETIGSSVEEDRRTLDRLLARAARKGHCLRQLITEERYDLIVATFAEAHTGGHQLWEYRRDAKGDGPRPDHGLGDGLLRLYQAVDREIGGIVEALPPGANVFVVSSVGLLPQYPTEELVETFCRTLGYQAGFAAGPAPTGSSPLRVLRRLLPDPVRTRLSRLLPLGIQARLFSQKFASATDWSRTTAYATPGYYTGTIRVNLRGRESEGIVEPGADYDRLLDRLEADLHALRDAETGEAVIARTVRVRDVFPAPVHPAVPDLLVFWHGHDRPLLRVRHPRGELTQSPHAFHRGSHHTTEGVLIAAGPSVRNLGRIEEVSPLALAPTLLTLLNVPIPKRMAAPPLASWCTSLATSRQDAAV